MSAVTYSEKTYAPRESMPAKAVVREPAKGFFRRLMEAAVAARVEQARAEYDRYVQVNGRDPIV